VYSLYNNSSLRTTGLKLKFIHN